MNLSRPTAPGRILLADDDEPFRLATAAFLRHHGFIVEGATDAASVLSLLQAAEFDLLISDIGMPGNDRLELVRELPQWVDGLPVILLTGQPTVETAAQAVRFAVVAYLTKPPDFAELVPLARQAIAQHRACRAVAANHARLQQWSQDLAEIEAVLRATSAKGSAQASWQAYLDLSLHHTIASLLELKAFAEVFAQGQTALPSGHPLESSRPLVLLEALRETIAVLEKTKTSFKSKELGDLRVKLERMLQKPGA